VRYESGEIRGVIGAFLDITQRRQIEAALQQSEIMFRTLADTMPQLFWVVQPSGQHEYCNQRWYDYTGLTMAQADGPGIYQIIHTEDSPQTAQAFETALQTGLMFRIEHRLRRASDGEYRWHLSQALPLYDENNQVRKWFGSSTDIHDQKLLIEERALALDRERAARTALERTSRMKDEFLAVVSHELRSPLNPILGWARLLQTRKLGEAKVTEALQTIERNARLQAELIEDLLDVSRILRGKLNLNIAAVDLTTTIQAAIETIRLSAEAKSIQLEIRSESLPGQVAGDPSRLQQIVWNLLSNAVKFTPVGGRIEVILESVALPLPPGLPAAATSTDALPRLYAQIQVKDTGKGIGPDFLPYVFEYFRQADSTTTRQFGGLGLGLAIVRHLVELHGGTIGVESPGEGQGATFTVQLPLMPSLQASQEQQPLPQLPSLQGIRVLVIDDDSDARELVTFVLEQEGAIVMTADSALKGLLALAQFHPDVLLSDIGMPEMDGYQLIRKVRALPPDQGGLTPAIALTAYAGEYDQRQALKAGFQKHLAKPVEPDRVVRVISELIGPEVRSAMVDTRF